MPYKVEKRPVKSGKNWAILEKKSGSWHIVGRSKTKKDAQASVRARYANED